MKIAHIVCRYPPYYGGMGNVAFEMAQGLQARGHDVVVYTPDYFSSSEIRDVDDPSGDHDTSLQKTIDQVKRLTPSVSYGNAARLPQLKIELDKFDLVHLHYPFFGTAHLVAQWKKKHPDKPLVLTYHMDARSTGWKGLIFRYYAKYVMPRIVTAADVVHVSSLDYIQSSDARYLYTQTPEKFFPLPFGVNGNRFFPGDKPLRLFTHYGLDSAYPTVVFVGGMDPAHYFKGIPDFLKALLLLKKQDQLPQVIFVGDGALRHEFELEATAYGIADRVRFVGRVSDEALPEHYRMGDVFVLPSIHQGEAFGMVLLEAMASGLSVIASDLPGVRTVARDGGIVVPPRDPASLAEALSAFFSQSTEYRRTLSQQARQAVEQTYSWERICTNLEQLYVGLVEKH